MSTIDEIYIKHNNKRFSLPDESSVDMMETRIGNILPQSYRRFLLDYNGGFFDEPNIVSIGSTSPYDKLTCLYGIGATHICAELEKSIDILDDNYPAVVLPIGDTLMGSLIIMMLDEEYSGQIVVKKAYKTEYNFLAKDILNFFSLLKNDERHRSAQPHDELRV